MISTRLTVLGGALAAALTSLPAPVSAQDITPRISASPAKHAGACPATITFNGQLRATGSGPVSYQWIRSDGSKSKVESVTLGDIGTQGFSSSEVTTTWKLGNQGDPPVNGWMKLRALSPNLLDSAPANFSVTCPPAPVELKAHISVAPADHKGACPATITFKGHIHSSKAGPVQYRWERSDGAKGPNKLVMFPGGGGVKEVQTTWQLGGPGMKYSGWERLHIVAPKDVSSNQANFSIDCAGPAGANVSAKVQAVPAKHVGSCPAQLKFFGQITSNKAGPVQYRWLRSDGAQAPVQAVIFAGPGTKNVQTTWQLGGPGLPKYAGWQAIQIVSPGNAKSNEANFSIECAGAGPAQVKAQAVAVPADAKGLCPVTVTFKGQIFSSKAGPVQYHWERSDGAKGPSQALNFAAAGSQNVQTTWQLGGPGLTKYAGWQRLHVVAPANVQSNAANFTMGCFPKK